MNLMSVMMANNMGPFAGGDTESATDKVESTLSEGLEQVLGKDSFLKLLLTQLRYQDPLKPVDDQNFIAQMAQFSALEQTQNLTRAMERFIESEEKNSELARATTLLGRTVEVQGAKETYVGTVDAVRMVDGVPRLVVQGTLFELRDVLNVIHEA